MFKFHVSIKLKNSNNPTRSLVDAEDYSRKGKLCLVILLRNVADGLIAKMLTVGDKNDGGSHIGKRRRVQQVFFGSHDDHE